MWVAKAYSQTLSRWTPLQLSDGVTGGGGWGGPEGSKTPQVTGIGCGRTYATTAHSQSLVSVTKVRNFTPDLSGCRTGGEEDGGR